MAKIVEFHEAAAHAEISLSISRCIKRNKQQRGEYAPRVLDHQKRMVQLTEREGRGRPFVKSERQSDLAPNLRHLNPENVIRKYQRGISPLSKNKSIFLRDSISTTFSPKTLLATHLGLSQPFQISIALPLPPNLDAFYGSSSIHNQQEQLRQSHSSMSWSKT